MNKWRRIKDIDGMRHSRHRDVKSGKNCRAKAAAAGELVVIMVQTAWMRTRALVKIVYRLGAFMGHAGAPPGLPVFYEAAS